MTIREAIREVEMTIEGGRALEKEFGDKLHGHDHYLELMETLLAAARKGAAEDLQTERDKEIEEAKELTLDTVSRAIGYIDGMITDVMREGVYMMCGEDRHFILYEKPVYTALAALNKVHADLLVSGEDAAESPRVHVVNMHVKGPEDMEKILKQVEGDLEKIFREAAEGKKEEADDER